ncbi:YbaB/EbfC family nucleoid-associated protein [Streptomyces sp. NPDC059489]|uniref:YbaB/EbfC family nucleoid-associated protein n=1 Tax=Streptomyces sp. NPDC059489 TaxID=3346849 RepID=UPI00369747D8
MPDDPRSPFEALARRADRINQDISDARNRIQELEGTGHGAGGLVRATVSGEGRLVGLEIDPSLIDPEDPQTLSETVIAAVDDAVRIVAERRAERISQVTGGLADIIDQLHQVRSPSRRVVPKVSARRPDARPSRYPVIPDWPADKTR